jgi:hypothetical protein
MNQDDIPTTPPQSYNATETAKVLAEWKAFSNESPHVLLGTPIDRLAAQLASCGDACVATQEQLVLERESATSLRLKQKELKIALKGSLDMIEAAIEFQEKYGCNVEAVREFIQRSKKLL